MPAVIGCSPWFQSRRGNIESQVLRHASVSRFLQPKRAPVWPESAHGGVQVFCGRPQAIAVDNAAQATLLANQRHGQRRGFVHDEVW